MKSGAILMAVLIGLGLGARADGEQPRECSSSRQGASTSPRMKSAEVEAVAKRAAVQSKRDLAEFERPKTCFNSADGDWYVFFNDSPVNGAHVLDKHFGVVVHDRDGSAKIMPGGG
jgi:hypothetical protein